MLMEQKANGISSKEVARRIKLRTKVRGVREIRAAKDYLLDHARTPSWHEAMSWCAGEVPSEEFFGTSLDLLKDYGILE